MFGFLQRSRWAWVRVAAIAFFIVSHDGSVAADEFPVARQVSPVTVEFAGGAFREAWDYNLSDEDLASAAVVAFRPAHRNVSLGVGFLALGVHQERVPSTFASGITVHVRWHRDVGAATYFGDVSGGLSYAAGVVPQRGTRFNYIAQAEVGRARALTPRTALVTALAWLHLSNNGLAGRARNPDVQAFGIRVGVARRLW